MTSHGVAAMLHERLVALEAELAAVRRAFQPLPGLTVAGASACRHFYVRSRLPDGATDPYAACVTALRTLDVPGTRVSWCGFEDDFGTIVELVVQTPASTSGVQVGNAFAGAFECATKVHGLSWGGRDLAEEISRCQRRRDTATCYMWAEGVAVRSTAAVDADADKVPLPVRLEHPYADRWSVLSEDAEAYE